MLRSHRLNNIAKIVGMLTLRLRAHKYAYILGFWLTTCRISKLSWKRNVRCVRSLFLFYLYTVRCLLAISGNIYYQYTRGFGTDEGYPKPMSAWYGVPTPVGAAFQWTNGRTFFFVGRQYYRFNDATHSVSFPTWILIRWSGSFLIFTWYIQYNNRKCVASLR